MNRNKLKLALMLCVFVVPIGLATWTYNIMLSGGIGATTNNGVLISPVLDITEFAMQDENGAAVFESFETMVEGVDAEDYEPRPWSLIFLGTSNCDDDCGDRLFYLRQLHRLLAGDEDRVARYYVNAGENSEPLDERTRLMFAEAFTNMQVVYSPREVLLGNLAEIVPPESDPVAEHYIFLADPLGNVMLYFTPENTPDEILEDIENLLDKSSLG